MIKEMKGFKVFKHDKCLSKIYSTGSIFNNAHNKDACIEYNRYNIKLFPTIPFSKLFFFPKIQDAYDYYIFMGEKNFVIYPCIAYNCNKITFVAEMLRDINTFWRLKKNKKACYNRMSTIEAPKNSWVAESIKIINVN
jgi:hypothetical protein